ncbi:transcriptional regulator [Ornithinimicrobium sp. Y1847]|uniref:transcriptional regulator n=1 Tax=Ornithinimicrobium sp. Y1847 TaxID=3405419 RepID=UPI003B671A91
MPRPIFDPVIHPPQRLQLCGRLARDAEVDFAELREELELSDSALSKHLKVLGEAGYVSTRRELDASRLHTRVRLTTTGREALCGHVAELQRLAQIASLHGRPAPRTRTAGLLHR